MKPSYEAKIIDKTDIESRKEDLYNKFKKKNSKKFRRTEVKTDIINAATDGVEI